MQPLAANVLSLSGNAFRGSVAFLLLFVVLAGCEAPKPKEPQGIQIARDTSNEKLSGEECTRQFNDLYDNLTLKPETINADPQSSYETLTVWADDYLNEQIAPVEVNESVKELLSPEYAADLQSEQFLISDIYHLRSSILTHQLANQITKGKRTEAERLDAIVNYVTTNIAIRPRLKDDVPRSPYEILLMGMGALEDRLWVTAELLDQNNLKPVIFPVVTAKDQQGNRRLYSYLISCLGPESPVYESMTGVKLTYQDENDTEQLVTLNSLIERKLPENFKLFQGTNFTEALTDTTDSPVVLLPVNPSQWPTRLELLQDYCVGQRSARIYSDIPEKASATEKLQQSLKLSSEVPVEVTFWKYPASMLGGLPRMTPQQKQQYQARLAIVMSEMETFRVSETPDYQYDNVGTTQELISMTERRLLLARINQLNGEYVPAGRDYMMLRIQGRGIVEGQQEVSQQLAQQKILMAADAHYWTALSQYEQGAYANARNTLIDFLNSPWATKWQIDALELLARSCAQENDFDACLTTIDQMVALAPNDPSYRILLNHWRMKAGKPLDVETPETEAKPEQTATEQTDSPESAEEKKPAENKPESPKPESSTADEKSDSATQPPAAEEAPTEPESNAG